MNIKLETVLVKRFPELLKDYGKPVTETLMTWGFECRDGWFEIIENTLVELDDYRVTLEPKDAERLKLVSAKQKCGTLRMDLSFHDDAIDDIIDRARIASGITCEVCGSFGRCVESRDETLCIECAEEIAWRTKEDI